MKRLKVAVIGIGQLGQHHARIYRELPDAELIGICDLNPAFKEKAEALNVPFYTDYRDIMPQVDALSIATPTAAHFDIALDCINHNRHVLIEKPITPTLEQADMLIERATKNEVFLRVGHIERYNAAFRTVKKIAHKAKFIEIHRLGPFTPRISDCGVVLDLMIHDLDIVLDLVSSPITYLDAIGINVLTKDEDIATARLKFENGAMANMTASRLTPDKQRKIRIFQEDAYISLDYQKQAASIYRKELFRIAKKELPIKKEDALKNELDAFIKAIQKNNADERIDHGARNALAVALQILESIDENKKRIKK